VVDDGLADIFVAVKFQVRWAGVRNAEHSGAGFVVGGPPAYAGEGRLFFVSVNQVLVRLWTRASSRGLTDTWVLRSLLFQSIFPGRLTRGNGIYVQRRCGDPSVDEAGGSHV
jgi:hypothetical protein